MDQETERADPAENIVQFVDVLRRRRSSTQVSPTTEPEIAPEDDEPPPDAA